MLRPALKKMHLEGPVALILLQPGVQTFRREQSHHEPYTPGLKPFFTA